MLGKSHIKFAVLTVVGLALTGCVENSNTQGGSENAAPNSTKIVERDVEAPEVFQISEDGLWDGRPSLGGVWVAHPTAKDPERVLIRNETNGKFVIGALFRKERDTPGPKLQVSSDAADAIGMIAGAPVKLSVTALRREEVKPIDPVLTDAELSDTEAALVDASTPTDVTETTLDPIASAAAALDAVDNTAVTPTVASTPVVAKASSSSSSGQSFLQLGIYSIEANANATAEKMRKAGVTPAIKKQSSKGKTFWRVIVGPVNGNSEKEALKKTVNGLGYTDAYFVSN